MSEEDINRIIRETAQAVIARHDNKQTWQNTVLAIIGITSISGSVLMYVMDAQTDKKISPIKTELSVLKNDFSHIRKGVDNIMEILNERTIRQ